MPHARFQLTRADVIEAARIHRPIAIAANPFYSRTGRAAFAIAIGLLCAFVADRLHLLSGHDDDHVFVYLFTPALLAWPNFVPSTEPVRRAALLHYASYPLAHAALDIPWNAAGIAVAPDGLEPLAWHRLEAWTATQGMMLLYLRQQDYIVLPARAFAPDERETMVGYLDAAGVPHAGGRHWCSRLGLGGMTRPMRQG